MHILSGSNGEMDGFSWEWFASGGNCLFRIMVRTLRRPATPAAVSQCPIFPLIEPRWSIFDLSGPPKTVRTLATSSGSPTSVGLRQLFVLDDEDPLASGV